LPGQLSREKPALVVISQGDNFGGVGPMVICKKGNVPYVTISQLAGELYYLNINPSNWNVNREGFEHAKRNYFVSQHNWRLIERMIGAPLSNAQLIFNPCKVRGEEVFDYPDYGQHFKIGLVGRIECFHKGFDLLLEVVKQDKWKQRSVEFNIYGKGPHTELLNSLINQYNVKNVFFRDHVDGINKIWKENQLLLMTSRMEGQSLSLVEAMFCKRTAVVTDVGGAAELITEGENGFIAEAATVEIVDKALERAWEQRHRWKQLGISASETIHAKHPPDEIVYFNERLLEVINTL
jgi:glycosyltransferase involved in cell wall biosynthesis